MHSSLATLEHRADATLIIDELKVAQKKILHTCEKGCFALRG